MYISLWIYLQIHEVAASGQDASSSAGSAPPRILRSRFGVMVVVRYRGTSLIKIYICVYKYIHICTYKYIYIYIYIYI